MDGPAATGGSSPTTITPPCVSLRFAVLCCAALRCSAIRRGCSEARRRHCPESPDNLPYVAPKTAPAPAAPDAARAPARRHTRRQPSRRATPPARLPFHCTPFSWAPLVSKCLGHLLEAGTSLASPSLARSRSTAVAQRQHQHQRRAGPANSQPFRDHDCLLEANVSPPKHHCSSTSPITTAQSSQHGSCPSLQSIPSCLTAAHARAPSTARFLSRDVTPIPTALPIPSIPSLQSDVSTDCHGRPTARRSLRNLLPANGIHNTPVESIKHTSGATRRMLRVQPGAQSQPAGTSPFARGLLPRLPRATRA